MSLWDRIAGEFIDVIEWTDDTRDTIVWRFERHGNAIKMGAKLTVREGQVAAFVHEGQLADVFQPGLYELQTNNMPIMTTLQSWSHGFNSPFKSEVYFISTRRFQDLKWGTQNPITMRDPEFGPVRLRAFGTYEIKVKDPALFLREVVGTDGEVTTAEVTGQLRNIIVSRFSNALAASGIPVLDVAGNTDQLGDLLKAKISPEIEAQGVELSRFFVENVSLPPAVEEALDKRTSMGVIGDLNRYTQFQTAEAIATAAANPGGAGGAMGAGMGMGMGMAMGNMMTGMAQGMQQQGPWGGAPQPQMAPQMAPPPPPPPPPAAAWHVAANGQTSGPFGLDQLKAMAASGQFTRQSMVWSTGMAGWEAAGGVAALAPVFAMVPPPPPPAF